MSFIWGVLLFEFVVRTRVCVFEVCVRLLCVLCALRVLCCLLFVLCVLCALCLVLCALRGLHMLVCFVLCVFCLRIVLCVSARFVCFVLRASCFVLCALCFVLCALYINQKHTYLKFTYVLIHVQVCYTFELADPSLSCRWVV